MAFEGHICCWHISVSRMVNEKLHFCTDMCSSGLYEDYSSSAVIYIYVCVFVVGIFVQGHMQIMLNVCSLVFLVNV